MPASKVEPDQVEIEGKEAYAEAIDEASATAIYADQGMGLVAMVG